jgi:hypothetical protein
MSFDTNKLHVNEVKPSQTRKERERIMRNILRVHALTEILGDNFPNIINAIIESFDRIDDDEGTSDSAALELEPSFAKPSYEPGF